MPTHQLSAQYLLHHSRVLLTLIHRLQKRCRAISYLSTTCGEGRVRMLEPHVKSSRQWRLWNQASAARSGCEFTNTTARSSSLDCQLLHQASQCRQRPGPAIFSTSASLSLDVLYSSKPLIAPRSPPQRNSSTVSRSAEPHLAVH